MLSRFFSRSPKEHVVSRIPGSSLPFYKRWQHSAQERLSAFLPWLSVVLLALLIIVPIGLFIWFVFFTQTFVVQAVTIIDARPNTEIAIKQIISKELDNVPLNHNMFFVQTEAIEAKIIRELPQVNTIHITRQLPGTIVAVVQEKTAAVLLSSAGKYYFVDGKGVAYEEARLDTLPGVILPTVKNTDQESVVVLGAPALSPAFVTFIQAIGKELPGQIGAQVAEIHIPSLAAREVYFLLNNNWEIRFDVTRPSSGQLNALRRVINEVIAADEKPKIKYIDLRIPDRIYYRTTDPVAEI